MKLWHFFVALLACVLVFLSYWYVTRTEKGPLIVPIPAPSAVPKPLLAYTFDNLKKTKLKQSNIILGRIIEEKEETTEQMFYFYSPSRPGQEPKLKASGVINTPKTPGTYPVILMFRGFIPEESYTPGAGTAHVAEVLAKSGYITLAPDFLGFGESDKPSEDSFEARFQTYTTGLTLLASLDKLNTGLDASYSGLLKADISRVGVWGHSNGGHIALAVLSISGVTYPTSVWAPVSKSFPYSMLYYSDEYDDQGKAMRKVLADFEELYDIREFSPDSYYSRIRAPLEIGQGTADQEVPFWWSEDLVEKLEKDGVEVEYHAYQGADHNMLPQGWSDAVADSINFYKDSFAKEF